MRTTRWRSRGTTQKIRKISGGTTPTKKLKLKQRQKKDKETEGQRRKAIVEDMFQKTNNYPRKETLKFFKN